MITSMKTIKYLTMAAAAVALIACNSNSKPAPQKPVETEPVHEATIEEYEATEQAVEEVSKALEGGMMPSAATE